jgi:hypothetical protein
MDPDIRIRTERESTLPVAVAIGGALFGEIATLVVVYLGLLLFWRRRVGPASTPAPSLLRCLRWMSLAGLPSMLCLVTTSHITTDLSPEPLLWLVPLLLLRTAWSTSVARTAFGAWSPRTIVIQLLAVGAIWSLSVHAYFAFPTARVVGSLPELVVSLAIVTFPFFASSRVTLVAQIALTALALLQIYANVPLRVDWSILVLYCLLANVYCGCYSDLLREALESDRLPEIVLCSLIGVVGYVLLETTCLPLIPTEDPDLVIAIVGSLLVRVASLPMFCEVGRPTLEIRPESTTANGIIEAKLLPRSSRFDDDSSSPT